MYRFETLEFPKKYPVSNWVKIAVLIVILLAIVINNHLKDKKVSQIVISNVEITDFSRVHAEISYTLQNKSVRNRNVWLLFNLYDSSNVVIGNALYQVNIPSEKQQDMIKVIDKLTRPLNPGEAPAKASVEIYKRKVF